MRTENTKGLAGAVGGEMSALYEKEEECQPETGDFVPNMLGHGIDVVDVETDSEDDFEREKGGTAGGSYKAAKPVTKGKGKLNTHERSSPRWCSRLAAPEGLSYVSTKAHKRKRWGEIEECLLKFIRSTRSVNHRSKEFAFVVRVGNLRVTKHEVYNCLKARGRLSDGFVRIDSCLLVKEWKTQAHRRPRYIIDPEFSCQVQAIAAFKPLEKKDQKLVRLAKDWVPKLKAFVGGDINLLHCSHFFVPVLSAGHWSLLCFALHEGRVVSFDTMNKLESKHVQQVIQKMLPPLLLLFKEVEPNFDADFMKWPVVEPLFVPNQQNTFDCGVYVLMALENWDKYVQSNTLLEDSIAAAREHLCLRVLNHEMNELQDIVYDMARQLT